MPDYKNMYFRLQASVADAIELLIEAQKKGEDEYIEAENEDEGFNLNETGDSIK